jgi:hypothetical protein
LRIPSPLFSDGVKSLQLLLDVLKNNEKEVQNGRKKNLKGNIKGDTSTLLSSILKPLLNAEVSKPQKKAVVPLLSLFSSSHLLSLSLPSSSSSSSPSSSSLISLQDVCKALVVTKNNLLKLVKFSPFASDVQFLLSFVLSLGCDLGVVDAKEKPSSFNHYLSLYIKMSLSVVEKSISTFRVISLLMSNIASHRFYDSNSVNSIISSGNIYYSLDNKSSVKNSNYSLLVFPSLKWDDSLGCFILSDSCYSSASSFTNYIQLFLLCLFQLSYSVVMFLTDLLNILNYLDAVESSSSSSSSLPLKAKFDFFRDILQAHLLSPWEIHDEFRDLNEFFFSSLFSFSFFKIHYMLWLSSYLFVYLNDLDLSLPSSLFSSLSKTPCIIHQLRYVCGVLGLKRAQLLRFVYEKILSKQEEERDEKIEEERGDEKIEEERRDEKIKEESKEENKEEKKDENIQEESKEEREDEKIKEENKEERGDEKIKEESKEENKEESKEERRDEKIEEEEEEIIGTNEELKVFEDIISTLLERVQLLLGHVVNIGDDVIIDNKTTTTTATTFESFFQNFTFIDMNPVFYTSGVLMTTDAEVVQVAVRVLYSHLSLEYTGEVEALIHLSQELFPVKYYRKNTTASNVLRFHRFLLLEHILVNRLLDGEKEGDVKEDIEEDGQALGLGHLLLIILCDIMWLGNCYIRSYRSNNDGIEERNNNVMLFTDKELKSCTLIINYDQKNENINIRKISQELVMLHNKVIEVNDLFDDCVVCGLDLVMVVSYVVGVILLFEVLSSKIKDEEKRGNLLSIKLCKTVYNFCVSNFDSWRGFVGLALGHLSNRKFLYKERIEQWVFFLFLFFSSFFFFFLFFFFLFFFFSCKSNRFLYLCE